MNIADRTARLAVPYGRSTVSAMALTEAAAGLCELLWLVDMSDPDTAAMHRMLKRFGTVIDLAGGPPGTWAETVAPHHPDGILMFFDNNMTAFANLAERLELPFHSPQVAGRLLDKSLQRRAFRDAGLPTPGSWVLPIDCPTATLEALIAEAAYPAVFKPRYGNDSKLTYPVPDEAALRRLIKEARSRDEPVPMVVEEYLGDTAARLGAGFANYLSVESLVRDGVAQHFAITGRFPSAAPFRETGFFIPATVEGADRALVTGLASAAIRALGVTTGALHTEIKFTPDGPRVIEVNGRLGGGVPLMFELAEGGSALRLAMQVALDVALDPITETTPAVTGFRFLFQGPMWAHSVTGVDGLGDVRAFPGVHSVTLHRGPGSAIDWRTGNHDYVFSVAGVAHGHGELQDLHRRIDEAVTVSYAA